jgi:hypothetical protein
VSSRSVRSWEQALFDVGADDVRGGNVELPNELRSIRRCAQAQVTERGHLAARPAGEAGDGQPLLPAAAIARRMLGLRPEVEIAINTSPRRPNPRICGSKMLSSP